MLFDCSPHYCCHFQLQSCHSHERRWRSSRCTLLGRLSSVCDCWPRASVPPTENYLTWPTSSPVLHSDLGWIGNTVSHKMAYFQLCLSRPFPCFFGSRGFFSVWLLEHAHRRYTGSSAGDASRVGVALHGISVDNRSLYSHLCPFHLIFAETLSFAICCRARVLTVSVTLEKLRCSLPAARGCPPAGAQGGHHLPQGCGPSWESAEGAPAARQCCHTALR